ncbi:MAG: hypothetical protein ACQEP7_06975 [bacterium]
MKFMFKLLISGLLTLLVILSLLVLFVVDFSRPELPETDLSHEERQVYEYTLGQLYNQEKAEVGITFSPREVSYFGETILPGQKRYGFEIVDIYMDSSADKINIKSILQGPLGLYYQLYLTGKLNFKEKRWDLKIASLKLGSVPATWLIPGKVNLPLPSTFAGYRLVSLNLDGSGLAARLHRQ